MYIPIHVHTHTHIYENGANSVLFASASAIDTLVVNYPHALGGSSYQRNRGRVGEEFEIASERFRRMDSLWFKTPPQYQNLFLISPL